MNVSRQITLLERTFFPTVTKLVARKGVEVVVDPGYPGISEEDLIRKVEGFDGVMCGVEPFTRKVIFSLPQLKSIARTGVGFDAIDLEAAEEKNVIVTTTPGANKHAVADHTIAFMIMLAHRFPENTKVVSEGKWVRMVGKDVYAKTLGIIGVGNIGKEVAKRAVGFGMKLLGFDIVFDNDFANRVGLTYVKLDELLSHSDFITLHVPHYDLTHHIVGENELALAKPEAYLINTARGGVVDEIALHRALIEKRLTGAALDVMENEPDFNSPLMALENVIWTPHVAGITTESRLACLEVACHNSWAVLSGQGEYYQVKPGSIG